MQTDGTMLITNNIDACIPFYSTLLDTSAELGAGWAQFALGDGTIVALHTPWEEGMKDPRSRLDPAADVAVTVPSTRSPFVGS